jgi:enoyl-CoA hydratase/carnithine racemase
MRDDVLLYREEGPIGYITLNAPPRNEMDVNFFHCFSTMRRNLFPGLNPGGLVVHGAGRHFSSGANVEELRNLLAGENGHRGEEFLLENVENFLALERMPCPVVAAVNGCCFGVGLELAMACRHRIATPTAVFASPEATFGLMPGCGGTVRLQRMLGPGKAAEIILSGRMIPAEEARELGLVDLIVDRKELLKTAEAVILKLGAGP